MIDLELQKKKFVNHVAKFTDYGNIKIVDFKMPVPTEQEAIGNITKEDNRHIKQVINSLKGLLGAIGLELVEIRVRDRKSRKKYGWKE